MAYESGVETVGIDLLTGIIKPDAFDIRRNRILAERCQCTLDDIVNVSLNRSLRAARLVLTMGNDTQYDPARVTVTLTDELGRQWGGDRGVILWRSDTCHGSGHFFVANDDPGN